MSVFLCLFFSSCINCLFLPSSQTVFLSHWMQFPVAMKEVCMCSKSADSGGLCGLRDAGGCGFARSEAEAGEAAACAAGGGSRGASFPASFTTGVAPSSSVGGCRGTAISFTGFSSSRPSSETACLTVPVAAGRLGRRRCCRRRPGPALRGRAAPSGREGGRGWTDEYLLTAAPPPAPRLRARTLPQRRPAWRGWWHRSLGRCGGLLRGGKRGSGRLASRGMARAGSGGGGALRCGLA